MFSYLINGIRGGCKTKYMDTTALTETIKKQFEDLMHIDELGRKYWDARELMPHVGYANWQDFHRAIKRAMQACVTNGEAVEKQFLGTSLKFPGKRGPAAQNYKLTRRACYFIFQNGDPKVPGIAAAQAYFVRQTILRERQQKQQQQQLDSRRVELYDRVESSKDSLTIVATTIHGVTNAVEFHEAGSIGMYNMCTDDVETLKGIPAGELMNYIDSAELAAHYFRITQTEVAMANDAYKGHFYDQEGACDAAKSVGVKVRSAMREAGQTMPEDLPMVEDIVPVRKRVNSEKRKQQRKLRTINPSQVALFK